ncbi:hypothetical protein HYFRA_00004903 [Hymenoscyphus fraxineus]|uniref:Kinetochore protein fta4 n=1 Tax=Hymenoscyphus fraxineus TaxID=746836 RepID=A0A9N9KLN7_9HELO|nr:hypothetical protein HYFRA_00004903 [Hymenoscyphus fraxineus]
MPPQPPPPSIPHLKTTFLRTQITTLSTPLRPSSTFLTNNTTKDTPLPQRAIDDAVQKLNILLRKHNKLAYGPQATRHVAEQIDRLYWAAAERGVVVATPHLIAQLPPTWSEEATSLAPEKAAHFEALQARLVELDERRRAAREKVERYKAMKELLGPFEEAGETVQGNIVVKNGEVERELERMRLLLLRVERGVGGLEGAGEMVGVEEGEEGILAILGD